MIQKLFKLNNQLINYHSYHTMHKIESKSSNYLLGAHVSSQGGPQTAIENCLEIEGTAFALFLKNQRRWVSPALDAAHIDAFKAACPRLPFDAAKGVLPHGSYLVNLSSPDAEIREKSYACFLDELRRCQQLGLGFLNIHPGSTRGEMPVEDACAMIAESINKAHASVGDVAVVLENTAGGGGSVGRSFEELAMIIDRVADHSRIGVCLDTCHLYAAGYDVSTDEGFKDTMAQFEQRVGFKHLKGMHLNDCKSALGSKLDRHELLGEGKIGLRCFEMIMNDPRFQNIPLILETPGNNEVWKKEIELLRSFIQ